MRTVILITTLLTITLALNSQTQDRDDPVPLMVEYIDQYQIKVSDLKDVLAKQFATISIGNVKTSSAQIKNSSFSLFYKNGSTIT